MFTPIINLAGEKQGADEKRPIAAVPSSSPPQRIPTVRFTPRVSGVLRSDIFDQPGKNEILKVLSADE